MPPNIACFPSPSQHDYFLRFSQQGFFAETGRKTKLQDRAKAAIYLQAMFFFSRYLNLVLLRDRSTRLVHSADFIVKKNTEPKSQEAQSLQSPILGQTPRVNISERTPQPHANAVNTIIATLPVMQQPSPPEPTSLKQALASSNTAAWIAAWNDDLNRHDRE